MRIGIDSSLLISRQMAESQKAISRSLERLASGRRVNTPRDDLAAFSSLTGIESSLRGLAQANLGVNQARGMLQTADAAISVQSSIVQRMRELALQGASGALTSTDRDNINAELIVLREEFERIAMGTEFNGRSLLGGSSEAIQLQTGLRDNRGDQLEFSLPDTRSQEIFTKTVGTGHFNENQSLDFASATDSNSADIDGDGDLDIITSSSADGAYIFLLNDGEGNFTQSAQQAEVAVAQGKFEVGDFNNDGAIDIIAITSTDISILLGNGDGTFQSEVTMSGAGGMDDFDIADINGDGILDLVGTDQIADLVRVFVGQGDGSFAHREDIAVTTEPSDIALGDMNGDGVADIVISNYISLEVSVLMGTGDGSFGAENGFATDIVDEIQYLELFDVDNDGDLDVFTLSTEYKVFLNDGSGSLTGQASVAFSGIFGMQVSDMDGDGIQDIFFSQLFGYGRLSGNGDGTFTQTLDEDIGGVDAGGSMSIGDFNGDGVQDFSIARPQVDNKHYIYLGVGVERSALSEIKVDTQQDADALISILDGALDKLNENRVNIALSLNRLDIRENLNLLNIESLSEAQSNLRDADFAQETANLVQAQILQQAQIAAFSQNNVNLQVVLNLFQSFGQI